MELCGTKNVCRACLTEEGIFQSVFLVESSSGLSLHISEMMSAFATIQLTEGDGLPEQICIQCAEMTSKMYLFKLKCEKSDMILRSRLKNIALNYERNFINKGQLEIIEPLNKSEIKAEYKNKAKNNSCNKDLTKTDSNKKTLEQNENIDIQTAISSENSLIENKIDHNIAIKLDDLKIKIEDSFLVNQNYNHTNLDAVKCEEIILSCPKCDFLFVNNEDLDNHSCLPLKKESYVSDEYFKRKEQLADHISNYRLKDKIKNRWFCNKPLSPVPSTSEVLVTPEVFTTFWNGKEDSLKFETENPIISDHAVTELFPHYPSNDLNLNTVFCENQYFKNENKPFDLKNTDGIYNQKNERRKRNRTKDCCYYCKSLVLNFARHLIRTHPLETEVQQILSEPVRSRERKVLITILRKKGNYLLGGKNCYKVMKKSSFAHSAEDYAACVYCFGFYSRKQLWRHRKKCTENPSVTGTKKDTDTDEESKFLHNRLRIDSQLRDRVLVRMRSDEISVTAQNDELICAFGTSYMKVNRFKVNLTSTRMRELARLMLEVVKLEPDVVKLIDCLQPKYYDVLIRAASKVVSYDNKAYALNLATSLKHCIDIALKVVLKKKDKDCVGRSEAEVALMSMSELMLHWRRDINNEAAKNMAESSSNVFKEFLVKAAESAKQNLLLLTNDAVAYDELLETIYCRLILLNKKHPGELQQLLLDNYENSDKKIGPNSCKKISDVKPTERVFRKRFRPIMVRVKQYGGVPVLFSNDLQDDIQILINARPNIVLNNNKYLFVPSNGRGHILGSEVFKRNLKCCSVKRFEGKSRKKNNSASQETENKNKVIRKDKKVIERIPWTTQQKRVVCCYFKSHIVNKKPPKRRECEKLIAEYPEVLKNKNWLKIKVFIQNVYTKKCSK